MTFPPDNDYNELSRLYGLPPVPESVMRLTKIIAQQDSDLEEVARVISEDPELLKRLLRVASVQPEEGESSEKTVERALMRSGIACVMLVAMGTPLSFALVKTFQTMLSLKLESIAISVAEPLEGTHVLGTIGFSGKAVGRVHLRLSLTAAKTVAARILGIDPREFISAADIDDAVGELLNIVTGNFKSNLCDAGLDCRLQATEVSRSIKVYTDPVPGGGLERMAFRASRVHLFVDVTVNPWYRE